MHTGQLDQDWWIIRLQPLPVAMRTHSKYWMHIWPGKILLLRIRLYLALWNGLSAYILSWEHLFIGVSENKCNHCSEYYNRDHKTKIIYSYKEHYRKADNGDAWTQNTIGNDREACFMWHRTIPWLSLVRAMKISVGIRRHISMGISSSIGRNLSSIIIAKEVKIPIDHTSLVAFLRWRHNFSLSAA